MIQLTTIVLAKVMAELIADMPKRLRVSIIEGTWCEQATYVGPSPRLEGERALIRDDPDDPWMVLAQFDRQPLYIGGKNLAAGWHQFFRAHFSVDGRSLPPVIRDLTIEEKLEDKGFTTGCGGVVYARCCRCQRGFKLSDYLTAEECLNEDPNNQYCGGSPGCTP